MKPGAATSVLRAWALIDLIVTLPLLLPVIARPYIELIYRLQQMLFPAVPVGDTVLSDLTLLFAALTGALGVLWALARWLHPSHLLGSLDTSARVWVGGLIASFIVSGQVPTLLWLFVALEWLGAVHQGRTLVLASRQQRAGAGG